MRNTIVRIGKKTSVVAAMALLTTTTSFIPAEAAVRAGDPCTRLNAKTKIGKEKFVCTRNPATKSKRLVWVWRDCMTADTAYRAGIESQRKLEETAAATVTMLKMDIENLKKEIVENEPEAKTWDAKAQDFKAKAAAATAKANELKASALKGGISAVDSKFRTNLQVALFDKVLTAAEVNQLATAWSTTVDKVPYMIEFLSAEDQLRAANSYSLGAKNSERKAASLRSTDTVDLKNRQIASAESNISLGKAQLSSLESTRKSACSRAIWRAVTS